MSGRAEGVVAAFVAKQIAEAKIEKGDPLPQRNADYYLGFEDGADEALRVLRAEGLVFVGDPLSWVCAECQNSRHYRRDNGHACPMCSSPGRCDECDGTGDDYSANIRFPAVCGVCRGSGVKRAYDWLTHAVVLERSCEVCDGSGVTNRGAP